MQRDPVDVRENYETDAAERIHESPCLNEVKKEGRTRPRRSAPISDPRRARHKVERHGLLTLIQAALSNIAAPNKRRINSP